MSHTPQSPATHSNALARETSPYLRQHASNPVDWQPWGPAALERARRENKPILLSIGYSACHWCHVMAHESFEDPETAALMNDLYVNIKVDREERPDLDRIYQIAHQMLTQRGGGWPLTMFLTPDDHRPFFGGTYFPSTPRYGMPSFKDLLKRVAEYYTDHEGEIRKQNAALIEAFDTLRPPAADSRTVLNAKPLQQERELLADEFDADHGGFGGAPKFPHPASLEFLMRRWHATTNDAKPDLHALFMATLTMTRMAEGGLFDQLGGGFSRYSVDQYWMIPHFEKMLYDNGPLLGLYARAAIATGDSFYATIARETAEWVIREMQAPSGGYYSSLDADSEGHEGKFYVWDKNEVATLLTREEYQVFERRFGLYHAPNFEGRYHLHVYEPLDKLTSIKGMTEERARELLDSARHKLLAVRSKRIWPGRDEKILSSWNGLMISGMAIAARTLREPLFAESATRALDFVRAHLWRNGRLLAAGLEDPKEMVSALPAYLDDYVFLAEGILELLQARWRSEDLAFAIELADTVLSHFADAEGGGFYFTANDHEQLMHRLKTFGDESTPNGNATAALVLNRLGALLGETRYLDAAERTLRAGWAPLERYPQGHATLLTALDEALSGVETVIIRGPADEAARWRDELALVYAPRRLVFAIPSDATGLPQALADKKAQQGTVAYICRGTTCSAPIGSLEELVPALRETVNG